jgi:hypothetical protein
MEGVIFVHFTPKGPHLGPSNFHKFGPMKEALRGRRFSSDEKVMGAVQNWLKTRSRSFSLTEFKKKLRNAGTGVLRSRGITLKSDISFVSVYIH